MAVAMLTACSQAYSGLAQRARHVGAGDVTQCACSPPRARLEPPLPAVARCHPRTARRHIATMLPSFSPWEVQRQRPCGARRASLLNPASPQVHLGVKVHGTPQEMKSRRLLRLMFVVLGATGSHSSGINRTVHRCATHAHTHTPACQAPHP
jgi:hypothetical protein